MGSRGGFDNGMAGGCIPLLEVDAVDVKIKLRAESIISSRCMLARTGADFKMG
jgi:hypothetical protein